VIAVRHLADRPELLVQLVELLQNGWPDYYGPGGPGVAADDLAARCRRAGLPQGFVAFDAAGTALGTAALSATSHGAAPGERPWLTGLIVAPAHRRQGIGSALVDGATAAARDAGYLTILATTITAAGLLTRRNWVCVRRMDDGHGVYRCDLHGD
jgi:GNAT superfamily N-acetyltransferase